MTDLRNDAAGKVGFLHTAQVHEATFEALAREYLPSASAVHRVDPHALELARQDGAAESVRAVVAAHLAELRGAGCEVVLCTSSTLGEEAVDAGADITVEVSVVEGAWDAFLAGDAEAYHSGIARAADLLGLAGGKRR